MKKNSSILKFEYSKLVLYDTAHSKFSLNSQVPVPITSFVDPE